MARRHKHEEHANHEAWAIPYGDLVTLLLAFFVVMYAISTLNEGKYRAVASSLSAAFKGAPMSQDPIQVGSPQLAPGAADDTPLSQPQLMHGEQRALSANIQTLPDNGVANEYKQTAVDEVINQVESTMANLIEQQMLVVNRRSYGVEIELRTDILFPSGSATIAASANAVLQQLAETLKPLPYPMRVEGHTDTMPINTVTFPSNWELSAARAASVVHLFSQHGMDPARLSVIGLGEFRPKDDNATLQGRNANRRVVIVILSSAGTEEDAKALDRALSAQTPEGAEVNVTTQSTDSPPIPTPTPITSAVPSVAIAPAITVNAAPRAAATTP